MKKTACLVPILLLLALPHAAMGAGPLETAKNGEIFSSVKAAIKASAIDPQQPVLIAPLTEAEGVRLHRFEGVWTGQVDHALVPIDAPISTLEAKPSLSEKVYFNMGWGHTRCRIHLYRDANFGVLLQTTDLDWIRMDLPGLNDRVSSIKTTCRGAWFFAGKDFNAATWYLYVPAHTNMASLPNLIDNHISSYFHDLD